MQPQGPQGISMQPILEALARRQMGGAAPMSQQVSMPTHQLPTGGASTPLQGQPQPQASAAAMPNQVQQGAGAQGQQTQTGALQAGQQAQGPLYDQQTRDLSKALVKKLLEAI